jgi:uncharacterized protein (UPF0332 family)
MTNVQEALLKKARRSLAAAKVLLNDEFYEAAVSRAYYTMFYLASALLHIKGLSFSKHGSLLGALACTSSEQIAHAEEFLTMTETLLTT